MTSWLNQVEKTIRERSSVRTYQNDPLNPDDLQFLQKIIQDLPKGPWNADCRFQMLAASPNDGKALRGFGTYGMIRHPAGFVLGVCDKSTEGLLLFGYQTELLILRLADRGIGTCWLGGSFTKSRFEEHIRPWSGEILPAVVSFGYSADRPGLTDRLTRKSAGSDKRKSWEQLFFSGDFDHPIHPTEEDVFNTPLEMVRLAPSASNRQPWRIVKERARNVYHFYISRNPRYQQILKMGKLPDLQMVDLGIAICHFDLSLQSRSIRGRWDVKEPDSGALPAHMDYVISWHD